MDKTYGFGAKGRRVESMSAGKTITAAVMGVVRLRTLMNKLCHPWAAPPLGLPPTTQKSSTENGEFRVAGPALISAGAS